MLAIESLRPVWLRDLGLFANDLEKLKPALSFSTGGGGGGDMLWLLVGGGLRLSLL